MELANEDKREEGEKEARKTRQNEMNQPDQIAIRPPRDNRWKTCYGPGPSLVEAAERAAEAVEHSDLKEEEEIQWKNQAGNLVHKSMDVFPVRGTWYPIYVRESRATNLNI